MNVYITKASKYLPNDPIGNEQMESFLGLINQNASKARRIVLRNNGILKRYYALDAEGNPTHSNAQLTALAVENLMGSDVTWDVIEVLSCGTSTPDVLLPSHSAMVHGLLGGHNVGSASAYLMLEALMQSGKLKTGDTILLSVPESGRFSYSYAFLRVV